MIIFSLGGFNLAQSIFSHTPKPCLCWILCIIPRSCLHPFLPISVLGGWPLWSLVASFALWLLLRFGQWGALAGDWGKEGARGQVFIPLSIPHPQGPKRAGCAPSSEITVSLKAPLSTRPSPSFVTSSQRAVTASAGHCILPVVSLHPAHTKPCSSFPDLCYSFLLGPSLIHLLKVLPSSWDSSSKTKSSRQLIHLALNSKTPSVYIFAKVNTVEWIFNLVDISKWH